MNRSMALAIQYFVVLVLSANASAQVVYVNANATGAGTGQDWANAHTELRDALGLANTEVWIAAGKYAPSPPGIDREASFSLSNGQQLYGGFVGTETMRSQRDPVANLTVLTGDLNGDDTPGWGNMSENSYHVIRAIDVTDVIIDGVTVTRGWAWVSSGINGVAAGMYSTNSTVTLNSCTFTENLSHSGAGLYLYDSPALVSNCVFTGNYALGGNGGGIYNGADNAAPTPSILTVVDSQFLGNTAHQNGGAQGNAAAIYSGFNAPVYVDGCLFQGNVATWRFTSGSFATYGGAMLIQADGGTIKNSVFRSNWAMAGGALYSFGDTDITNCLFANNEAKRFSVSFYDYGGFGGAIVAGGITNITNCTLHANKARNVGGIWGSPSVTIRNSIVWSNIATEIEALPIDHQIQGNPVVEHSCIRGLFAPKPGEPLPDPAQHPGSTDLDPMFIDMDGPDGFLGNADDDIRLSFSSPCIDAADNAALAADITIDIDGNPRYFDDPATADKGVGPAPIIDMGAMEFGTWIDPGTNQLPVADFEYAGEIGTFDFVDLSADADGTLVQWVWDFGDNTSSTAQNPTHLYQRNGVYEVSLAVRDNDNGTNRSSVQLVSITGIPSLLVTIVDPPDGGTVGNIRSIEAVTNNDASITQIKFYDDGIQIQKVTAPPFIISWNTNLVADGPHTLTAKATDINEAEVLSPPVVVNVDNATPFITSAPFDGQVDVGSNFARTIVSNGNPAPTFSLIDGPTGLTLDVTTGAISFLPTAAQLGGPYFVTVRATNPLGFDEQTSQITVVDNVAPSVPTGLTASNITETSALLSWNASTDNVTISHYDVYRWRRVNRFVKGWVLHQGGVMATSLTVTSTLSSVKYYAKAVDTSGNTSPASAQVTVQYYRLPWIYHNPTGQIFAVQSGVRGTYAIHYGGYPAPTYELIGAPVGMTIDAVSGLISWTPTEAQIGNGLVTVRGTNLVGFAELVVNYSVGFGPDTEPPSSTPTPTVSNVTAYGADLSWAAAADNRGIAGYLIKAQEFGAGTEVFDAADSPGIGTTFTLSTLNPSTDYDLWISAYDAAGNQASIAGTLGAPLTTLPATVSPPSVTILASVSTIEGGAATTSPVATVSDIADVDGSLLVQASGAPIGLSVAVTNSAGMVSASAAAACGVPAGIHVITLSVTDSDLFTVTAMFDVVVTANPAPIMGLYPATTVSAVESASVTPSAPPSDTNGSVIAVSVDPAGLPTSGALTVDPATGVVSIATFIDTVLGDYLVTVTATDNCGATTSESFVLTVASCAAPVAASTPDPVDLAGGAFLDTQLSWNAGLPAPVSCVDSFDIYFDTVNPPTSLLAMGLTTPTVATGPLAEVTTYFWQVVTVDCCGETASAVWSFTTVGVPHLAADVASVEYFLAPNSSQINQIMLTNVGTGNASWTAADLPVPVGQPAAASREVINSGKTAEVAVADWSLPHKPDSLIVTFHAANSPKPQARRQSSRRTLRQGGARRVSEVVRDQIHEGCGTTVTYSCKTMPVDIVKISPQANLQIVAAEYASRAEVAYVEPNYTWTIVATPNDTDYGSLWGLNNIGQSGGTIDADIDAPAAWNITTGSRDIIVGVIDTGIDYTHPDLAANMWTNDAELNGVTGVDDDGNGITDDIYGARWIGGTGAVTSGDPYDDHFHGTHVAGTIGALGNNTLGVVGVNWNVRLMALKFLNSAGGGSTADAISAIEYAVAQGAHITSNSWGGGGASLALKNAIETAGVAGQLFVAAAGNSARNADLSPMYPAAYDSPTILSVASMDRFDNRSTFSNWGLTSVDLAAPGTDILSTSPGGFYRVLSGTSMATPHVSGVAALALSRDPSLSALALKQKLMDSVELMPSMNGLTVTGGRVNAAKAVEGLSWMTIFPRSGILTPGQSVLVDVTADATGHADGFFESGLVRFTGGDPAGPLDVSASLSVGTGALCLTNLECDDGLFCNGTETCINRFCQSGLPVVCNDDVGCTVDSCVEATQSCQSVTDDLYCDNGLFCDGLEFCDAILGCLTGAEIICDDGVGCTNDFCDLNTDSCQVQPNDLLCDNGIFCDGVEACDPLVGCQFGVPVDCDDGVVCTVDACDEATANCGHTPDDVACQNGFFCDGSEVCDANLGCGPGTDPCGGQACDELTDACVACLVDMDCDDGLFCNGVEVCDALGQCQIGTPASCDDGVMCTVDACNSVTDVCTNTPNDLSCDDGLFCSGTETCDPIADCQIGTPVNCGNLSDQCSTGICDEATVGCLAAAVPDGTTCDNADACFGDICLAGACDPAPCSGPAPPTGFQAVFDDAARLGWDAMADPDTASIAIYRSENTGGPYSLVVIVDGGDLNFDDEPPYDGVFCYVITLIRSGSESANSVERCGTVSQE